jgi:glycosyltransferase involved in cell wall biosynthesis
MKPKISVNLAVHYDLNYLEKCLKSILKQDYPDFEILLVLDIDSSKMNRSDKDKAERGRSEFNQILENIAKENYRKIQIRPVFIQPCSIGVARQTGVSYSKGEIIAFIDPDIILPDEKWLEMMTAPFLNPDINVVWTLGTFHREDPAIVRYSILCSPYHEKMVPGTGCTLIRKSAIVKAGGFRDLPGGEDGDLVTRLQGRFEYMPDCLVYHYHAVTISKYLWKHYRNARKAPVLRIHNTPSSRDLFGWIKKARDDPAWLLHPFMVPMKLGALMTARLVRRIKN